LPATLALVLSALAGCIQFDGGASDDDETPAPAEVGDGNETTGPANEAPTAVIAVTVANETNHTYTFDASNSTDPEGGNLSYAWDFGDGETAMGVTVNHTFNASASGQGDATGNESSASNEPATQPAPSGNESTTGNESADSNNVTFVVTLVVADDQNATDTAKETISFAAGPPKGVLYETHNQTFEASTLVGTVAGGGDGGVVGLGVDYVSWDIVVNDTTADGYAVEAQLTHIILTASGGDAYNDLDLYLLDSEGNEVASSTTPSGNEEILHEEPLPAGDYTIAVYHWSGAAADITVELGIEYYTV
jgi:hypothetical protein